MEGAECVTYSCVCTCNLGAIRAVRLTGATLDIALETDEGFKANNVTLEGLVELYREIRRIERSLVPSFFFEKDRCVPRRFIAGGTIILWNDVKYVLALWFIGYDLFVKPIVLSAKNLREYYFLVVQGGPA